MIGSVPIHCSPVFPLNVRLHVLRCSELSLLCPHRVSHGVLCRRQGPQLALGMADAYGHEDDRAKFSQAEVDAKIKER